MRTVPQCHDVLPRKLGDGSWELGVGVPRSAIRHLPSAIRPLRLILALAVFVAGIHPALADICIFNLSPASTLSVGLTPQFVTTGDFNNDGRRDLVVANQFSANVSILLGNGNGTFQSAVNYFVGQGPLGVAVGDFNGDSRADLAVANSSTGDVSVMLGNGNGTFQQTNSFLAGSVPSAIVARDFTGDNRLDLAVANRASGDVSLLVGNGDGTFQDAVSYAAGVDPVALAATNFNNDARNDLAVANAALFNVPPSVTILMGRTTGATFQNGVDYDAGISPRSVAVGDFNADGKPDIAVADYGQIAGSSTTNSALWVLLGNGNGTFANAVSYTVGNGPLSVAVGDFDTNGIPDLVVANERSTNISVLVGNGNGTFQPARNFYAGMHPRSVAVGNFNADTKPDVAVVNDDGVLILLNTCLILADLGVTKTDAPDPVGAGLTLTYTFSVTNGGPVVPPDVTLTDPLPAGMSFVSATTSQGTYTNIGGTVTCSLGTLNVGAQATVTITVTANTAGTVTNTATVSSLATSDPNVTNNTARAVTTVLPRLSVAATDPSAAEAGSNIGIFTITRAGGTTGSLNVNYGLSGTAVNGADYNNLPSFVTIPNGSSSATVIVTPVDELAVEPTESVVLTLSPDPTYAINPLSNNATVNILDDDVYAISINDVTLTETDSGTILANFALNLSWPNTVPVSVNYATANGTAIGGSDYIQTNGIATFAPGQTNTSIFVAVVGDLLNETNETFFVNLSNAANGVITDSQAVCLINNNDPLPTLAVSDVTLKEGSSGTTNAIFTVSLSAISGQTVTFSFATVAGTATAGVDYVSTNGTLTIPEGSPSQTFAVRINGDTTTESNETFFVNISNPGNATIADGQGLGTIINAEPAVYISDVAVVEGDAGTTNAVFTLSLTFADVKTITVDYATADGSATAPLDYLQTNGTVSFPPGVTNQTIAVTVLPDLLNEANDTFFVNLSNPTNTIIGDAQAIGTIVNDDPLPSLTISDATVTEGDSGTTMASFTLNLSAVSGRALSVNFATANGSATAGADFVATNGTVIFPEGSTSQTIIVPVIGDLLNEADDTYFVNLTSPTNVFIADSQGLGTILNNDPLPSLTISDVSVTEINAGSVNAVFTVNLSAPSGRTLFVDYSTANGSAVAGNDYTPTNGTLMFLEGTTTQLIPVAVLGDLLNEANETFFVNLANPFNATIGDGQGVGTILNDDPLPSLSINDVVLVEGNSGTTNAVFTVTLSAESGQNVTVNYATAPGSATGGADYTSTNGSLSFPPGTTVRTLVVPVIGDLLNEADDNFFVNLSGAVNATLGDSQGTTTILNDDPLPTLTVSDVSLNEGNSGTVNATFTVNLSAVSGRSVSVNFATADGTAIAGSDYQAGTGIVVIPAGAPSQTFNVAIQGDLLNEADETFFVNLSNPTNVVIADSQAMGTIRNDDPLPGISINNVTLTEGNSGSVNALFSVSLSAPSGRDVSVNYTTTNGTASAGLDYVAASGLVSFPAGSTTQTIPVTVLGELEYELNETFFVNLSGPVNAVLTDSQGLGTINNDDSPPVITVANASVFEGNSGTVNLVFTARLSAPSSLSASFTFSTANDVAKQPGDYTRVNNAQVSISPGQTNQTFNVVVNGDTSAETNETFLVNFSSPVNATLGTSQAIGTILNDDGVPFLTITDATLAEGNSGTTNALFSVRLSASSSDVVTVSYATANGTALAGADYLATNGVVSFPAGTTNQTIAVKVIGDQISESNKIFFVNLSGNVNALISDGTAQATIVDDDPLSFLLSTNAITVGEGSANSFGVRLLGAPVSNVSVSTTRTGGSTNLSVISGATLTFTPVNWNVFQPVTIAAAEDANLTNETAIFTVSNGGSQQTVTVTDVDNDQEQLKITSVAVQGANIAIQFTTSIGQTYRVERTASLSSISWVTVDGNVSGTGSVATVTDIAGAGQPARFYRVVRLSP